MAVTHDDVCAIAALARLTVSDDRLDALVAELNGILRHMDVLSRVDTTRAPDQAELAEPMRVAPDAGPSVALSHSPAVFAPEWRDGFFLVPRVASHGEIGAAADEEPLA
jgi:aspartyl-tRNA(Asn)/glutamyl-tRNA(Gln) amidotransferase subunit C